LKIQANDNAVLVAFFVAAAIILWGIIAAAIAAEGSPIVAGIMALSMPFAIAAVGITWLVLRYNAARHCAFTHVAQQHGKLTTGA